MTTTINIEYDSSNVLIEQLLNVVREMGAKFSSPATKSVDETCMTDEEFYARIDAAKQQIQDGKGKCYASAADLMAHIKSL